MKIIRNKKLATTKAEQVTAQQIEDRDSYLPSPLEIAEETKIIREGWSKNVELIRRVGDENRRIAFEFLRYMPATRRRGIVIN